MPYIRKPYTKYRRYKRPMYKRKFVRKTRSSYIKRQGLYVNRRLTPEWKTNDFDELSTSLGNSPPNMLCYTQIAQGVATNQRIGNDIMIRSIHFKFHLYNNVLNQAAVVARIIVFTCKFVNGTMPAMTDIFTSIQPDSFRSLKNADNYTVLMDKSVYFKPWLNLAGTVLGNSTDRIVKFYKKVKYPIRYGNTGSNISDVQEGGVFVCYYIDTPTANDVPGCYTTARIRYTDM